VWIAEEDEDEEMDPDYIPMDEDEDYSSGDEPEPSLRYDDSEGMSSEIEDLGMDERYYGNAYRNDSVSVHDAEDEMDLPEHEKGLSSTTSPYRPPGEGSKRQS